MPKISKPVWESATLALVSSLMFYLFRFPFSLFCFLTALWVSVSWALLMTERWRERRLELRPTLAPYVLLPAVVLFLAITYYVGFTGWVAVPLDVLVALLVPGIGVLSFIDGRKSGGFSFFGMACALSVIVNGLLYFLLAAISVPAGYFPAILLGTYFMLSLVPVARKMTTSDPSHGSGLSVSLPELVCISGYIAVIAGALLLLYPTQALVKSLDITTHFTDARLASMLQTQLGSPYPFFKSNQAIVLLLSRPPAGSSLLLNFNPVFQATFASLGAIVLMFTFHRLAKDYLKDLGSQAALVATGIFMFFGGLAWTQVQNPTFGQPFSSAALDRLSKASYWDIQGGPGQTLWFWFRPFTLGILFLMLLLSILATRHESPRRTVVLVALLVTGLYFVYIPELLIFVALLLILAIVKPFPMPGLEEVAVGLALSCPFVALLAVGQMSMGALSVAYPILGGFILASLLSYAFVKFVPRPNLPVGSSLIHIVGLLSLVAYVSFMIIWLVSPRSFSSTSVAAFLNVPIGMYPVLLGIGGVLALSGLAFYDELESRPLIASIFILVVFFVIGQALSLLNFYAFFTGFWERRIIPSLALPLCILASFSLVRICSIIRSRTGSVAMAAALGLVVVLGTSSMLSGVTYGTVGVSPALLGSSESPVASYLASNMTGPHLIFPSASETNLALYAPYVAGNISRFNLDEQYPEVPLISMVYTGYGSSYVLASTSDVYNPVTSIGSGYMVTHLLDVLPVQYASDTAVLYSLGNVSAPSPASRTCIDMAAGPSTEELFAYDMLSVLKANYTAVLDTDASLARCSNVFLGASMSQPALEQLLSEAENASITVFGGVSNEYLSNLFLRTAGPQQTNVDEVSTPTERLLLPSPLPIALAQPAPGVEVTSEYIGPPNVSIPLSLRTVVGGHEIDYINIEPFIETPRATYPCFPIIAEAAGIHVNQAISVPNPYGSFEVAFTSASLVGTTSFKTASVVIDSTGPTIQVDITSEQGSRLVTEAASLSVYSDTGTMTISTPSANITGGAGFYAYASVGRSLTGEGSDLQARLNFLNGTSKVLGSIREFSVSEPAPEVHGLELTVRSPTVGVSGSAVFTKLEPLSFPTFSSLKRSAKATFAGNVSFDLPLSDYYSIVQGLRYSGGATYSGASLALTEASSLYGISPELVAAGLVLAWWYHFKRPSRGEASRHLAEQEDREA